MNEQALRSLRQFTKRSAPKAPFTEREPRVEHCELCAQPLAPAHQHLMDPKARELICTCDGCVVLFDSSGLTKYRRVPREVRTLPDFQLTGAQWEKLLVPIQLAFFYRSSHAGRTVALYPSPAGVTESVIEPEAWQAIVAANPGLEEMSEDVEALLVNRLNNQKEYFRCPMDRCFELVGLIRTYWRGFTGGDRVWTEVERFLSHLKEGARS